ncbi:MAG: Sec-independent protein translocase subunit TatA [Pseudomonadota bacterium]
MGSMSIWHWLIVLVVVLVFFGNRLPNIGSDLAKGIKGFKDGIKDDDAKGSAPATPSEPAQVASKSTIDVDAKEKTKS